MLFNKNKKRKNERLKSGIAAFAVLLMMSIVLVSTASASIINVPVDYGTIQEAITAATPDDTIIVAAGSYVENLNINKAIELRGSNYNVNPNTDIRGAETVISGQVTLASNGITLNGLKVIYPGGSFGVYANSQSNILVTNNIFDNIGTTLTSGSAQAIYIKTNIVDISDVTISNNKISNVGSTNLARSGGGSSAKGIFVGDSTGSGAISNLIIRENDISAVYASIAPWGAGGGAGAYGILINHASPTAGGLTRNPQVLDNRIGALEGLWAHAIGLEGNTPYAVVTGNSISNLVDHKIENDAIGVLVEDNPGAGTLAINNNIFGSAVDWGVVNKMTGQTVNAENNWWGSCDGPDVSLLTPPSGIVAKVGSDVDFDPWTNTCSNSVPEFPTIALPILSIIGLMFLLQRRKGN